MAAGTSGDGPELPEVGGESPVRRGGAREHALDVLEFFRALELVADHASGEAGAEHVRELRPATRPRAVEARLEAVDQMIGFLRSEEGWAPPRIPPLRPVLERLDVEGTVLEGEELVGVARLLASSRSARRDLRRDAEHHPDLAERAAALLREPEVEERISDALDQGGSVLDGASRELGRIRRRLRSARADLTDLLEELARDLPGRYRVPDGSVTVRNGRYCIPVRREGHSKVGGIVHDESSSGQTLYVEPPAAIEPMNELRELRAAEGREVRRILRELTREVRPLAGGLASSLETLVEIDSLYARARYALEHGSVPPEVAEGDGERGRGTYRVTEAYHPLLLAADEPAVPFSLSLEPGEKVLLVSGPNAGGKTVLLKAVGLLSALAQSGVVPPVGPDTRLPLFRRFFAIIGDEQSIEASLSSFSAQMEILREILDESGPASLVLLDEIGSHTDPAEGAALASAAIHRLAGQAGLTVTTTHLGELKAMAGEDDRVVNASLQFDPERLRPTYRLRRDRPGRSYALEIAERLGLPDDVLEAARSRLGSAERRMEEVLAELEQKERELERLTRETEERERRIREVEERLGDREEELDRREREVERAARERAEEYLLEAREDVESAIERLEEEYGGAPGEEEREAATTEARGRVEDAVRDAREAAPEAPGEPPGEPPELEEGQAVRIRSLDRRGTVRELRDDEAVVEAGGVRLTLPLRRLEPAEEDGGSRDGRAGRAGGGGSRPRLEARAEVDLRGSRVDEVEGRLHPALDAAHVADLPRFRIIHGKGTGALRQRVRQLLEEDPRVTRFRDGEAGEGGRGVTVVEFGSE